MVNRHIPPDTKVNALRLWEAGFSKSDICWIFRVSRASLYCWRSILEELGSVSRPPSPLRGRPRQIGLAALSAIKEIYETDSDAYLDELQWYLAVEHDIAISISGLQRTLQRAGLTRKILHKIASERDEALREDYMQAIREEFQGDGDEFVFVDESSKNKHTLARRYGRSLAGTRANYSSPFVRGERYSLIAAMSTQGYIATEIVPGLVDSFMFFDFIVEKVLPAMNPFPDNQSVLVMDNCQIHRNDALQDVLNNSGFLLLYLPPYSPDLNLIEESFSVWKGFLRRYGPCICQEVDPILALLDSTGCITAELARKWIHHAGYIVHAQ